MPDITQIPAARVDLLDPNTGLMSRAWYRYFFNQYTTGGGGGGGSGTVTSVALSLPAQFTVSGSPVTTAGTLAASWASQTANYVLAAPNGSSGTPTFRLLVAADIPTLNQNTTGTASNVTGVVAVVNGGTGSTTASTARTALSAAQSGANTDITSVALTTGTITTAPASSDDLVNKSYADSIASGINFHAACQYATTVDLGTVTYNNGTSGVGATLTNAGVQATLVIDGYTFTVTDVANSTRVLVKDQSNTAYNGVYTVTNQGSLLTNWVLTRATDYDTSGAGINEVDQGDMVLVIAGSTNNNTSWVQQTPLPITIGTTGIVFIEFAAIQTYTAGTGLTLTTNQFSITNTGTAGTYGSASAVPVFVTNAQGQVTSVTNTSIAISGSAVSGNISGNAANVTGTVAIANGGSGQTTAQTAMNAFAGATTSGSYLRGNGTNVVMSAIQAADVPTLNQNTTGSAGSVANALTIGTGLSGTSYNGSAAVTIALAANYGDTLNPYASKSSNLFLAAPNGSAGVPTFRLIGAADIPTLNQNTTGTASNVTGIVAIANGGTGQTTASAAFNALSPVTTTGDLIIGNGANSSTRLAIGANNYVLTSNGTTATWAVATGSGATITNDTTTATNVYPTFAAATSGALSTVYTSNAKLLYKPSTGELASSILNASNGIQVNSKTVSVSYTIASGNSGMSAGPITIASGQSVTVSSGSRWVVL